MRGITLQAGDRIVIVADQMRGSAGTVSGICADGHVEIQIDQPINLVDAGPIFVITFHESQVVPEAEWCICDLRVSGCTCGAFAAEQARKAATLPRPR